MGLDIIGAGFGRTATMSLKMALERLNYGPCYHMSELVQKHPDHLAIWSSVTNEKNVDWNRIFANYRSTVDWPSANYCVELAHFYPEARVILTERDPNEWYTSVMNTIYPKSLAFTHSRKMYLQRIGAWITDNIWEKVFNGRIEDKDYAIDVYLRHIATVKKQIPHHRLFILDNEHGWESICDFLQRPIPSSPYPHINKRQEFHIGQGVVPNVAKI